MKPCATFITRLITGKDNQTPDVLRIGLVVIIAGFLAATFWHLWHGHPWDPLAWGSGAAAILGGGGAGVGMKAHAEPDPQPLPPPRAP